jgi:hypothetical protein
VGTIRRIKQIGTESLLDGIKPPSRFRLRAPHYAVTGRHASRLVNLLRRARQDLQNGIELRSISEDLENE